MTKRTKQLFFSLVSGALACAVILPGCSDNSGSTNSNTNGGSSAGGSGGVSGKGGGAGKGGSGATAGVGGTTGCSGAAPACRGLDLKHCCEQDPFGPAVCQTGKWICSLPGSTPVAAPGCNGQLCGIEFGGAGGQGGENAGGQAGDGSAGQAGAGGSAECVGQAPDCFGSNLQNCCGNDPAGIANCENGKWMCFGVAAPGCNGQSCI